MTTLHLYPRARHVEDAIEAALAGGAAVALGADRLSRRDFVERVFACRARPVRLGSLGERLLIDAITDEADGPLAALCGGRGFAEGLRRTLAAFKEADLAPDAVRALATRLGPGAPRLRAIARLYALYQSALSGRADDADVIRAARASIAGGDSIPCLSGIDAVVVHDAADLPAPFIDLVRALAARGLPVEVRLPSIGGRSGERGALDRALEPVASAFERDEGTLLDVVYEPLLGPGDDSSPRARFFDRLFRRGLVHEEPIRGVPIAVLRAPSPEAEARAVARHMRDLLDAGVPPDAIAVVAREPGVRERVAAWLTRYRVPHVRPWGTSALLATPVRIALRIFQLVEDGVPREGLIALIASRYVSGWAAPDGDKQRWIPPHRIARMLREAGVRDDRPEGGIPGYRRRLGELAATREGPARIDVERVAAHVESLLALFATLPGEATLGAHAAAFGRVTSALGIELAARGYSTTAEAGLDDADRVAFDQAALGALGRLLGELPRAALRAGLAARRIDRVHFARLLEASLGAESVRPGGARGGTVELVDPDAILGCHFEHLVYLDLRDGVVPTRSAEDALFSDEDRHRLRMLAGRPVLSTTSEIDAAEPLRFLGVLAAGASVLLCCPTADGDGRLLLHSPYLDEVMRAAALVEEKPEHAPTPRAEDARLPAELLARAALECDAGGERSGRIGATDPGLTRRLATAARARYPALYRATSAVADIERARLDFFDGRLEGTGPEGRFVGFLGNPALAAELAALLPGGAEKPLSATALEDYGRCGFRFFAARLLGVRPREEMGDELDVMTRGRLHHRILERFFRRASETAALPLRGDAAERALLLAAADAVVEEWQKSERRGHPALFSARAEKTRTEVASLVAHEAKTNPFAPHLPRYFEHAFEVDLAPPPGSSSPPLRLKGTIDRIDVDLGTGSAVVLDYKTGRSSGYKKLLGDDALLVTSFQLPVYAAAARATLGLGPEKVRAHYYGIRDAATTAALEDEGRFSLQAAGGAARTVADEVFRLYDRMRGGDFRVLPRTCDLCSLHAACRVVVRPRAAGTASTPTPTSSGGGGPGGGGGEDA